MIFTGIQQSPRHFEPGGRQGVTESKPRLDGRWLARLGQVCSLFPSLRHVHRARFLARSNVIVFSVHVTGLQFRNDQLVWDYSIVIVSIKLFFSPRQCPGENLNTILWTPLQQLAHFWGADMIAMSPHVEVPSCALLGEECVTAIQVLRIW